MPIVSLVIIRERWTTHHQYQFIFDELNYPPVLSLLLLSSLVYETNTVLKIKTSDTSKLSLFVFISRWLKITKDLDSSLPKKSYFLETKLNFH